MNEDPAGYQCWISINSDAVVFGLLVFLVTKPGTIGVRAGGARGAAAPPRFGQLRFFGQHEKIWAKPVFKDVSMFFIFIIILKR